jgi:hypothetical protein
MSEENLDIDDYNIPELMDLIDIDTLNKALIIQKTDSYIQKFNEENNEGMVDFFRKVQVKLLDDIGMVTPHNTETLIEAETEAIQRSEKTEAETEAETKEDTVTEIDDKTDNSLRSSIFEVNNIINTQAVQNNVNPITPQTISQVISINSIFRDNYDNSTSTDFIITLPVYYSHVIQMKLSSAEIPNTYYIFDEALNNNKFCIKIYELDTLVKVFNIIIPTGSWYADDIVTFMNDYIDNNPDVWPRALFFGIDMNSGKAYFRWKTEAEIKGLDDYPETIDISKLTYSLDNCEENDEPYENTALYIFGFSKLNLGIIISYDSYQYGNYIYYGYLQAINIYGFTMNTYIYLSVEDFVSNKKDQIIGIKRDSFIGENILARIQVSNPLFSIIINNGEDHVFKSRDYFGDVKIRKLRIKVLDKYGEVINLNHSDVSLSLELTQRYSSAAQTTFNDVLDNSLYRL